MNAEALDERIFYRDSSKTEFDAQIIEIENVDRVGEGDGKDDQKETAPPRAKIRLDATVFYPEGGGQPPDTGWIGGAQVIDVQEIGGKIWHTVIGGAIHEFRTGATVHLRIDRERRLYHTQQHTGQHLLSAVLEQEYDVHTLSFHLGEEYCTIDVSAQNPADVRLAEIEANVEDWIARDVPVRVHYCPPEDISSFRLRKRPPADEAVIRVVEIDRYDWSPCGGTHVERTGQIRALKILSVERYKGNTRLYFVAGTHAVRLLSRIYDEARSAALLLNAGVEHLSARVQESMEKTSALDRKYKRCAQQSAEVTVALATAAADPIFPIVFTLEDEDAERATTLVRAASAKGRAGLALSIPDMTVVTQTPSGGDFPALATALKPAMVHLGGRGGGGPNFFRANFGTVEEARRFLESAEELLRERTSTERAK